MKKKNLWRNSPREKMFCALAFKLKRERKRNSLVRRARIIEKI